MNDSKKDPPSNKPYEQLGEIIYMYLRDCINDVIPYEYRPEEERLEMDEVMAFSVQTSLAILEKFAKADGLDLAKLKLVYKLIQEEKFEDADDLIFGEELED